MPAALGVKNKKETKMLLAIGIQELAIGGALILLLFGGVVWKIVNGRKNQT